MQVRAHSGVWLCVCAQVWAHAGVWHGAAWRRGSPQAPTLSVARESGQFTKASLLGCLGNSYSGQNNEWEERPKAEPCSFPAL